MRLLPFVIVLVLFGCKGEPEPAPAGTPEPAPASQPAAADDPQAGLIPAVLRYLKALRDKDTEGVLAMTRPKDRAFMKEDLPAIFGAKQHPALLKDIVEPIEAALEHGLEFKRVVEESEGETWQLAYGKEKLGGIAVRTLLVKRIDGKWFVLDID